MEKLIQHGNDRSKKVSMLCHFANFHGEVTNKIRDPEKIGSQASLRLQIIPSLVALNKIGYQDAAYSLHYSDQKSLSMLDGSLACLIGKLSANNTNEMQKLALANLNAIRYLKQQNIKIILMYCDNHIFRSNIPLLSQLYKELFAASDYIIYPTQTLKTLTEKHIPKNAKTFIIKDPWQIREERPYQEKENNEPWKIIWFGSNKSVQYLCKILPGLLKSKKLADKYELTILGSEFSLTHIQSFIPLEKNIFDHWTLRLATWNSDNQPEQLETELNRSHISIIPTDHADPLNQGTSHNRIVDSIRSGCLPIASPLPSYQELAKISILGNDFENLLFLTTFEYKRLINKHNLYRSEYLNTFSPQANFDNWTNFWHSALNN